MQGLSGFVGKADPSSCLGQAQGSRSRQEGSGEVNYGGFRDVAFRVVETMPNGAVSYSTSPTVLKPSEKAAAPRLPDSLQTGRKPPKAAGSSRVLGLGFSRGP